LRRVGSALQFIHKSLFEYYCARLVLLAAGSEAPLPLRLARTRSVLALPGRRIQAEPEVRQRCLSVSLCACARSHRIPPHAHCPGVVAPLSRCYWGKFIDTHHLYGHVC
jgi:hypothetical protein